MKIFKKDQVPNFKPVVVEFETEMELRTMIDLLDIAKAGYLADQINGYISNKVKLANDSRFAHNLSHCLLERLPKENL